MHAIGLILAEIGWAIAGLGVGGATAVAIGAAVVVGGSIAAAKAMGLFEIEMPQMDSDASRQTTVKSTVAPQKIIYGEALVSGPISYIALSGASNADLYQTIVLAGHEVNAITDIYFDDEVITNAQIAAGLNTGSNTAGNVTAGTFGPIDSNTICVINKHLGAASQASDPMLTNKFALYTSAHRGEGIAYLAMKWTLDEDSAEVWEKYSPGNVKALVQGKLVYDPRLEVTAGGTAGASPTNAAYVAYSTNPALCVTDYLIDQGLGMGIAANKIDWAAVITAANGCDVDVDVPNSATQKRFTANGVLFGTDSHQKNINKLLSAMNGRLIYSNGKYIVKAGIYEAPTEVLTEDDLIGAIQIKTSLERSDRFNTIRGIFVDAAANNKSTEFPKVQLADAVTRDNGEVLEKEIQLPMVSDSYQAQRIANKLIQLSDQQKIISFPANLSALRITAGDRVQVTVEELSWNQKVFECVGWTFSDEGGVNLTLREDSSTSYGDPLPAAYSQITADGTIVDAFRGVPSPSGLSVTAGLKNNVLNWVNPGKPSDFGTVYVYASPNGNFSSAVKIGETDGTQFAHDASTAADAVAPGDVRYYWVRAIKNVGTDAAARSNLEPNADPNTTVFATVGRVNWADVSGTTGAPQSNATVGAQISVNLYDADGSSVMSAADVKNSVLAQEILEVEVEAGEVLNLETGADVDIQNLGDVAIFVSDSNVTLNTSINTVAQNLSALEDTVVDLTSGVSDIYIGTAFPVPGQSGIPDPIPTFSRFYKSDDGNHPYYWTGSAWTSLKDAEIAQNSASITNLTSNLATTNTNVTANSSAITALDTLTIAQGNSITSLSGSVTALESTVNNATTGVVANAGAVSSLTTRVTNTENATTVNAGNITNLTADLDQAELDIATKASSTAVSGLTTRVDAAENSIVTNAGDITALESTVDNATTGVVATANAVSALTTRVSDTEDGVLVNSGAVTTLNATYTEDLHFRTEAEDESDNLIDLEAGSGTVQLQDLTDFVSGSSAAIDSLTVQTFANEDGIQTQAIQLTALESTVNDPTNGVTATAGALSTLSTTVSVIDNQVSTTAQDLTTLTTTVGGNTATITTQSNSIDGVEANYSVKIDNNNRITGFGLLSTTAGSTPFSEFAVVADQFSIVSPDSTSDTPIQPFTVTSDKIYLGTNVVVSGDLVSTGKISADVLQVDGVTIDTQTVGNVTSLIIRAGGVDESQIAQDAVTTAKLANDAVTVDKFANTLQSTNYVADTSGWQILTSGDVEFQNAKITGDIVAETLTVTEANITGTLTLGGGVLQDGAGNNLTTITTLNANQTFAEVSGASAFYRITTNTATAPTNAQFDTEAGRFAKVNDIVITTDTTTTPDTTYGWTCTVAGGASTEATWQEITDFISGDLLVDGTITADQIAANTITANEIVSNAIGTGQLTVGVGTTLGLADTASQVNAGLALLLNKDTFGNANTGEASLVSVDKDGNPLLQDATTTSNGFIQWNGSKITVEAVQYTSSSTVKFTVLTGLADKRGFIVFDTTKSNPFTVDGVAMDVAFAFKEGDKWYYDNNVSAVEFTPNVAGSSDPDVQKYENIVALGYLETGLGDQILKGGLINPVTLTAAAFPSDVVKSGSIGGVLITPTTIESNFVTGVSGFQLKSDGTLEAGNGTFRGAINATSLTIGASASVSGLGISDVSGSRYVDAIYARGTGFNNTAARQIKIGNTFIVNAVTGRGFTLSVIKKSDHSNLTYRRTGSDGTLAGNQVYDVHGSATDQINMRDALVELRTNGNSTRAAGEFGSDIIIIIVSYDAWNIDTTNGALLRAEMKLNGATSRIDESSSTNARVPYLLIATAGIGEGNGIEVMTSDAATADYAQYSGTLVDGEVRGTLDGLTQGVIINKGGLTMDLGGAIKTIGKDSESDSTAGYFLGYNGSNYTFGVGDATESMQWTGSALNVVGSITATSLTLSAGVTIAKSVVGLTNVDDVSQATIQSDTLTAATSSDVGLGDVENLDAQNQAQTGLIAGTTITGGGITMSAGGAIKTTGKDSESDATNGFFLGYNGTNYTFGVGDANQSMQWTGSELNIVGALNATSLNVTNITGAVTGFDAGKISGEVTEVYPLTEEPAITLNNDDPPSETVLLSFSTPAPENSVSKRNRISLGLEFSASKAGGSGVNLHSITYWVERKSIGFEASSLGNVTFVESLFGGYVEKYTISGNVTLNLDSNGAVASNTNPTAAQIGRVAGVSYDSVSNKTKLTLEFGTTGSQRYSNNALIYFSPSQFTSSGVYTEPSGKNRQTLVIKDNATSSITVPMIQSFGATTAARDYRIYAKPDIQYVGVIIKCNRINGSIENIA